ncbi:hypothetical protein ASPVEDRAFT_62960 [Aspergillus versicolor CBS 583.65]|uniref:FAD-binding 8 domain-containing protein n=1 Tax=Aspergillus versicolor CBS 583.65 TaxID=1036611 RepID=A0A1L9PNU6_ASPVE|nr:uncharacterized protein ASPVEDRAFT_62960 [Aspergillus versicolor CBS 583.65]OJJ03116.1 hypothetical protein ASPVEDRAFT_62960 [Aspergillus versicolor CBS 583.65]
MNQRYMSDQFSGSEFFMDYKGCLYYISSYPYSCWLVPLTISPFYRMDPLVIYAITAGSIFTVLLLIRTISLLAGYGYLFSLIMSQHLTLLFVIYRHWFLGPWTRAGVFLHLLYTIINIFLLFFRIKLLTSAGRRAGELALVNLIFPLSTIHLAYLADLLSIKWNTCRKIHQATGWMAIALLSFHIITAVQGQGFTFPLHEQQNLFTMLAAISLGALALHSIPWTWQHLLLQSASSKIYLFITVGTFVLTFLLELITLLYNNGLFAGNSTLRAIMSFSAMESKEGLVVNAVYIRVLLPRRVKVQAGQYINLWMPAVSLYSWMQTHPFMVMSWSKDKQDTVELLVKPCSSFTAGLLYHAPAAAGSLVSFLALFTSPHGVSEKVSNYKSILLLASGSGIAIAIPYLKKMIYGYNTCTSQVRWLHLVWQVESVDKMTPVLSLINNLLKDDIMDNSYILYISIYIHDSIKQNRLPFSRHKRVYIYQEVSGNQVKRLPNTWDQQGRTLVMGEVPNFPCKIRADRPG